jgi:hypothetical protein
VTLLGQLQQLVTAAQQQQQQMPGHSQGPGDAAGASGLKPSDSEEQLQRQQLQLWLLLCWQALLLLPAGVSQLTQPQLLAAAQQLLQVALHGSVHETELELSPGMSLSGQDAAAAALTQLAAWPAGSATAAAGVDTSMQPLEMTASMQALNSCAAQLLQLLKGPASSTANGTTGSTVGVSTALRSRAVVLLGLLGSSSAAAAWQVLQWLQPLVLACVQQGAWVSVWSVMRGCVPTARWLELCLQTCLLKVLCWLHVIVSSLCPAGSLHVL